MIREKLNKLINSKYFIPCFVVIINVIFFIICNLIFEPRYETVDDFTITKIISKLDGTYSFYSIYIHPILSYIIMLLYKTGININWYTIFLLTLQFMSFTIIGVVMLNKNKKIGTLCYVGVLLAIYSNLLLVINYTSIAAISVLSGIISLIYYCEYDIKKYKLVGLILITIGTMLRWKSAIISLPFYILYICYNFIRKKDIKLIKNLIIIVLIILTIVISNGIIYKVNPIYAQYTRFNNIRTYFFDSNVLDYEENKEIFNKIGWSYADWKVFYTYSFSDENFYNFESLNNLKGNIEENLEGKINKAMNSFKLFYLHAVESYMIFFIVIIIIILFSIILKKNRRIILSSFIVYILVGVTLYYTKPVHRVIISLYSSTIIIMLYFIIDKKYKIHKTNYISSFINLLVGSVIILYTLLPIVAYKTWGGYKNEQYKWKKEIIEYTNSNKDNAYVYPNSLSNISLAYSVYEKISDDTFLNLCHMGDWDIYNKEYFEFKKRYNIDNIITDLYKKDNLYVITGDAIAANNRIYKNHIDIIIDYIEQHYNVNVKYKIIKEFKNFVKVYKLYEEKKGENDEENISSYTNVL